MKKLLAIIAMLALLAAACGSDDDSSSGDDGASSDDSAVSDDGDTSDDGAMSEVETLNVAYFSGWPLPPQIGQEDGSFAEATGVGEINWVPFPDGGSMADAMIAGDIDISYSIGLTPFAVKATNGAPIKMVGIAVSYADADNCFVSGDLGYTRDNASETLKGATILTPIGNVTHYKLLNTLEFLNVDESDVTILPHESGDSTAASFASGQIEVGCAFGGPLVTMAEAGGVPLLTGDEVANEVGIKTYDVTAVRNAFADEHPDVVTGFLRANEEFNQKWASDPDTYNPVIAQAAGMEEVGNFLSGPTWFTFPTLDDQLSDDWLGSSVAEVMLAQMTFFKDQGQIDAVADDYAQFIDTSFLANAK
ncbi:MAG: ABC transporter substrate-binding protein [Acidimicrobiales bacterium]|nr:ABC transporter substrate-binding protein [Acidimicrobiales bacterium]